MVRIIACATLAMLAMPLAGPSWTADKFLPPSDAQMTRLVNFTRPCPLKGGKIYYAADIAPSSSLWRTGDPIWWKAYDGGACSLVFVDITLFRGGTFLRPEVIRKLVQITRKIRALHLRYPRSNSKPMPIKIFPMGNGRIGYQFVAGFGPGGGAIAAVATSKDGKFDLMVNVSTSYEDDTPPERKMKNPARPQVEAADILKAVEAIVFKK